MMENKLNKSQSNHQSNERKNDGTINELIEKCNKLTAETHNKDLELRNLDRKIMDYESRLN